METNRDRVHEFTQKHVAAVTNHGVTGLPDGANIRYVIHRIEAGGDVAGTLQVNDSDGTAINGLFLAWAAGQRVSIEATEIGSLTKGRGIRYTTTGGGNHSVYIRYSARQE